MPKVDPIFHRCFVLKSTNGFLSIYLEKGKISTIDATLSIHRPCLGDGKDDDGPDDKETFDDRSCVFIFEEDILLVLFRKF